MEQELERNESRKLGFLTETQADAIRYGLQAPPSPGGPNGMMTSPRVVEEEEQNVDVSAVIPWVESDPQRVYRVVLTGGPCAGKTTSMERLTKHFQKLGYRVYRVPELATMMFTNGIERTDLHSTEAVFHFQKTLVEALISLEDAFYSMALNSGQKSVLFCDRGTLDGSAYMERSVWQAILDENGWTNVQLRDKRYDCVVHMVTAAWGAPQFYNRSESPEEAIEMDLRLRAAWLGHPYLVVIDNTTDFEEKLSRVLDVVARRIEGKKESKYRKRKFLLEPKSIPDNFPVEYEDFYVTYDYLLTSNPDIVASIRKRGQNGSYTYTLIFRKGSGIEKRKTLQVREYLSLLKHKDPKRSTVVQKRRYFLWGDNVFHLDWFRKPEEVSHVIFLQAYISKTLDKSTAYLPEWLKVIQEVSDVPDYSLSVYSGRAKAQGY